MIYANFVSLRRRTEALFSPLAGCKGELKDWRESNFTLDRCCLSGERSLAEECAGLFRGVWRAENDDRFSSQFAASDPE